MEKLDKASRRTQRALDFIKQALMLDANDDTHRKHINMCIGEARHEAFELARMGHMTHGSVIQSTINSAKRRVA